jgi:hypothetical protein
VRQIYEHSKARLSGESAFGANTICFSISNRGIKFLVETLPAGGLAVTTGGCTGVPGCAYNVAGIPGWTNSGTSGQWQPRSGTYFFNYIPDRTTVAYSNDSGGTITQSVSTVTANTTYTLQVDLGNRKGGSFSLRTVELLIGTTPVVATGVRSGTNSWKLVDVHRDLHARVSPRRNHGKRDCRAE